MKTDNPTLRLEHAWLKFEDSWLFQDLTMDFPKGGCTCLLGSSGVGKTSLLRLIGGLLPRVDPCTRCAFTDGTSLANGIAYLSQKNLLVPWKNVRENCLLGFRLRGKKVSADILEKLNMLLTQTGLQTVSDHLPQTLSGGMQQRVALIRTFLEHRPLVLLDEPFSALDVITRYQLQSLTALLLKDVTTILVTHDPLEALRLGHRIYVLQDFPVRIAAPIELCTPPPRDIHDEKLLHLQAELFDKLRGEETLT